MPEKKRKEKALEKPSLLESDMYERVENFFREEKDCDRTGSEVSRPIALGIFGGTIRPDAFGVTKPTTKDFKIYMGEGKLSFRGRDFDICKGQAITLQRFADHVYVFFPRASWNELDKKEQSEVISECENLRLGLLIVDKSSCEEKAEAHLNHNLIQEERRVEAKDRMVQYFPDFARTEENDDFFEKHVRLADSIVKESVGLLDYLGDSFRKCTPKKKSPIEHFNDEDYTFEFYRYYGGPKIEVFLIVKPFGSDIFETSSPTLLIQERYKSSLIKKRRIRQKFERHIEECLDRKGRVETDDYTFYHPDTSEEIVNHVRDKKPKNFSIFEQIEILGIEKEHIRRNVERSLERTIGFEDSLK